MASYKKKILVHTCCAACASYVFSELEKEGLEPVSFFFNPEIHGHAEYLRRLNDVKTLCESRKLTLIAPEYNMQEFFSPLMPFQDKRSIKYISDKKRYRRKRCQLCISLLVTNTIKQTKSMHLKYFTTSMLCSPYRDHDEIWNVSLEMAVKNKINFFYKDFRKGYWNGRNFARAHGILIPKYCGCTDSLEEGRLE